MKSLSYDLHIHSCLSPCGDADMTPNNIAGMVFIKKLGAFAVCDHNSCRNCAAAQKAAEGYGLTFIPGMELTTAEEIHVVCLFPHLQNALRFDKYVYDRLQKVRNDPEIFGNQYILDEDDNIIGEEEMLLINATTISFDDVFDIIRDFDGTAVPAHIDKPSNSLLSQLGFVPPESSFKTVEVKDISRERELKKNNPYLEGCRFITSSDAHYLEHINEPVNFIHPSENTPKAITDYLKSMPGSLA